MDVFPILIFLLVALMINEPKRLTRPAVTNIQYLLRLGGECCTANNTLACSLDRSHDSFFVSGVQIFNLSPFHGKSILSES